MATSGTVGVVVGPSLTAEESGRFTGGEEAVIFAMLELAAQLGGRKD